MAKPHRTSAPPTGAHMDLRNMRLYGGREEQIAGAALSARGCPNPNRVLVTRPHRAHLQRAQDAMLAAQRAVRAARLAGQDTAALAATARNRRAEYLKLTGGVERREVEATTGASSWDEVK
jgi:hypothetical protein